MGLADKIEMIHKSQTPNKCAYIILLESMEESERKALDAAWEKGISQRVILAALRSEGYKTSNEAIRNHRDKTCKCHRK
jgi:hypothetical protein